MTETEFNRLYWFFRNIRKGIATAIGNLFKKYKIISALILILLVAALLYFRASYQPAVLWIRKYSLLILFVFLMMTWYWRVIRKRTFKGSILPTIFISAFLAFMIFVGPPVHNYLKLYMYYGELDKVILNGLPETGHERIQPVHSLKTLINQEALSETEDATFPKFIRGKDDMYYYSSAVGPSKEYRIQQMRKDMYEVIRIPAHLPAPVFSAKYRDKVNFEIGELLLFSKETDNAIRRGFSLSRFFSYEASEPMYLQNEKGEWVQVVPLIRWKGWVFPRPVFGGVVVIDQKKESDTWANRVLFGAGHYIAPDEINQHKYLQGQNLIPPVVARNIAESFRFTNGFFAPMPGYHEGDIRIPAADDISASQPFVVFLNVEGGKICNYFGLEPYQPEKKGLSLSLFIPGDSDSKIYFIEHRKDSHSYIGSSAVPAKIVESRKNYDWSENYPAESRPFIRNIAGETRFFWLTTIVTRAGNKGEYIGGSIPELTLTDATYGKVTWVNQDSLGITDAWIRQLEKEMGSYW
ncbi:MAG: hypothetical protein GC181_09745 [Bacteroidetes bacterium]|nr:hypothetical protein [Bacteroidota bacterium]